MAELGFLGLGSMGSAMAHRLVDAGHTVRVWNRTPDAMAPLIAAGAIRADSASAALAAPVSFSMLANDEAADSVLSAGAIAGAAGRIHVNTASISPELAGRLDARFRAAGVGYVAATVLGRPPVAAAGALNIMVAGPAEQVAAVTPYLEILGARLWSMGENPATANVVKVAVNYTIIHALQAMAESMAIVERQGMAPADFVELLSNTLFGGVVYAGYGDIIAQQRYRPAGFTVELGLKDLSLAERSAADVDLPLPTAPALRRMFETAIADPDLAGADWAAMAEVTRRGHGGPAQ